MFVAIGKKIGMTRLFQEEGTSIPVTVVEVIPNRVVQVKTVEKDGYSAVQITTGKRSAKKISKALSGHFSAANTGYGSILKEFRCSPEDAAEYQVGKFFGVEKFQADMFIDVSGSSKGKGFAGVVKRWNFRTQDATHGNSLSHRAPGSIGQCQTPGRVFKGKKMAGQMGNKRVTVQNLKVAAIDEENNLILIRGGIPGSNGSHVLVQPAVKKHQSEKEAI